MLFISLGKFPSIPKRVSVSNVNRGFLNFKQARNICNDIHSTMVNNSLKHLNPFANIMMRIFMSIFMRYIGL